MNIIVQSNCPVMQISMTFRLGHYASISSTIEAKTAGLTLYEVICSTAIILYLTFFIAD